MRIAVVDDEADLRKTLMLALSREGYSSEEYRNGRDAWMALKDNLPDLMILDVTMPEMDGLELCRKIRGISETVPVLFLSSRDEEIDRILGLEIGGDDYMCKPFSVRELMVKIKVLLRRSGAQKEDRSSGLISCGELVLDTERFSARWRGSSLDLTVTEFSLLRFLAERPGIVRTREHLMNHIYSQETYVSERTIDTHIKRLRQKIEKTDREFNEIETVYGLGYRYREVSS